MEGHIDPEKHNKPGQKQSPTERGPGGEGGTRSVPASKPCNAGS